MLVLSRKPGESIFIGEDIEIRITRIKYSSSVQIAISAPRDVLVVRSELIDDVEELRKKFGIRRKPFRKSSIAEPQP